MTWMSIADDREKYKAYLCSREWALLRNAVRARCGGKCERCKVNEMECVHHLTYARKYNERIEDLAGWCNACHEFTHAKSDKDPARSETWVDWLNRSLAAESDGEKEMDSDSFHYYSSKWNRVLVADSKGKRSWRHMLRCMLLGMQVSGRHGIEQLAIMADEKPADSSGQRKRRQVSEDASPDDHTNTAIEFFDPSCVHGLVRDIIENSFASWRGDALVVTVEGLTASRFLKRKEVLEMLSDAASKIAGRSVDVMVEVSA